MIIHRAMSNLPALLRVDAIVSLVAGVVLIVGAGPLATATALPQGLLFGAGVVFLAVGAFLALIAEPSRLQRPGVMLVIIVSAAWVLASVGLAISEWVIPNALGLALILLQAVVVGCFATLEHLALRA